MKVFLHVLYFIRHYVTYVDCDRSRQHLNRSFPGIDEFTKVIEFRYFRIA
jgi:hypothetical protein